MTPIPTSTLVRRPSAAVGLAAALLLPPVPGTAASPAAGPPPPIPVAGAVCPTGALLPGPGSRAWPRAPKRVRMTPTARARGARGTLVLTMSSSPYGVAVDPDGSYRVRVEVTVEGLRPEDGIHHVAWAATPELDRHVRVGPVAEGRPVTGELAWNKFLVFVTAEATPEPEAWSQEILLSALSPSGRMHTMAGHGPFSGEPCLDPRS